MTRVSVASSYLTSIGYNDASETLEVQFKGRNGEPGIVWAYSPVPRGVYAAMMLPGSSIGSIFSREVKSNPLVTATRIFEESPA